jgi:hypothetical protein
MATPPKREPIAEKFDNSRTAHLQPLIDFLKAQGNQPWPVPSYRPIGADGFDFDRDGYGNFYFRDPLDLEAVRRHFSLPATITAQNGAIWDERNGVGIVQAMPASEPFHFDL